MEIKWTILLGASFLSLTAAATSNQRSRDNLQTSLEQDLSSNTLTQIEEEEEDKSDNNQQNTNRREVSWEDVVMNTEKDLIKNPIFKINSNYNMGQILVQENGGQTKKFEDWLKEVGCSYDHDKGEIQYLKLGCGRFLFKLDELNFFVQEGQ